MVTNYCVSEIKKVSAEALVSIGALRRVDGKDDEPRTRRALSPKIIIRISAGSATVAAKNLTISAFSPRITACTLATTSRKFAAKHVKTSASPLKKRNIT